MAITVTNETMAMNTANVLTAAAATSSVINTAEEFQFTPGHPDEKYLIIMDNVATDQGTVTYSIAAGAGWAAGAALTGSVAQGVKTGIVLESAKYMDADGVIKITVTPATGERLYTDHAFQVFAIALP